MADNAFERVCAAVQRTTGNRPTGGLHRRRGLCPAHADDKPSLSIRNDEQAGLVGVTCFAGCSFTDIAAALDLTASDFRSRTNGHRPVPRSRVIAEPDERPAGQLGQELARYRYTDAAGNLLYYNIRFHPKNFRMADRHGEMRRNMRFERVPYNLPAVVAAAATGQTIYWVEGEKDADRINATGQVATTSAGGANVGTNPVQSEWAQYFIGAHLVVVADNDAPGLAYARAVGRMAINTAESVRLVKSATPQAKSDVSDHLDAGYSLSQLVRLPSKSVRRTRWTVAQILETKPEELRWVLPGIIPEGLTLLVGAPKMGKSWWNLNLMVALATGRPEEIFAWGQSMEPSPSLYAALEDPHRRLHQRLHKVIRNLDFPAERAGDIWLDLAPMQEGGRQELEQWIESNPTTRAVMVDVLAKVRGKPDTTSGLYQADYEAISVLKEVADTYSIGVIVTHHDRKKSSEDFLDMVSGTKGVTGAADTILYLKRERGKDHGTLQLESRDVEDCTFNVQFIREFGRWHIVDRVDAGSETANPEMPLLDQICQVIFGRGETSYAELASILSLDAQTVRRVCTTAERDGALARTDSGLWYVPRSV